MSEICLFCLSISPFFSTYDSTIQSEWGAAVAIGDPFYLSVSYENPQLKVVGQNIPTETIGASLGYRHGLTDGVTLFLEGGYYWPETSPLDIVENEIVEQVLINDHGKPSFEPEHFRYELEPGFGGRIGLDLQISKRFSVFGAYRFLKLNEKFQMCNFEEACVWPVPEGGRFWSNKDARNYSSIQVGFTLHLR